MKLLAELLELHKSLNETSVEGREENFLIHKFGFSAGDAEDIFEFALGETDWTELSDEVREKLYSWCEKTPGSNKAVSTDPTKFVLPVLRDLLNLK